jgi:hypothetical protein
MSTCPCPLRTNGTNGTNRMSASRAAQAHPLLRQLRRAFGIIPNIAARMANPSVLLKGMISAFHRVLAGGLAEPHIHALPLINAITNAAEWAVAFHIVIALCRAIVTHATGTGEDR